MWKLLVDSASDMKKSGFKVVLEGPYNLYLEKSLNFKFKSKNNQVENDALIASMNLAIRMGTLSLRSRSDSKLITNQIAKEYQGKESHLIKYLIKVRELSNSFRF